MKEKYSQETQSYQDQMTSGTNTWKSHHRDFGYRKIDEREKPWFLHQTHFC